MIVTMPTGLRRGKRGQNYYVYSNYSMKLVKTECYALTSINLGSCDIVHIDMPTWRIPRNIDLCEDHICMQNISVTPSTHSILKHSLICFLESCSSFLGSSIHYDINFGTILDPPPPWIIKIMTGFGPPPLNWWCHTWTKGELTVDFSDTIQIIKICFSIILRNIFWGLGAVFKIHEEIH